MKISILTLFPDNFTPLFDSSILKRAQEQGLVTIMTYDLRQWAVDKNGTVDDPPFGGGADMVMRPEPFYEGVDTVLKSDFNVAIDPHIILLTPQGQPFRQKEALRLSHETHLILLCGHYEGVDERVRNLADEEISLGDFVLTGGEIPAMAVVDAVVRLLPGALGNEKGTVEESFSLKDDEGNLLLEYPQYTRPREYRGLSVPDVLLSGNHAKIKKWRQEQSFQRTQTRRPDLTLKS